MSSVKTNEFEGDMSIGRNMNVGGTASVQGDAKVKKNLTVEGWLDARYVKGPNKGLYVTETKLKEAYPIPDDGDWALVGSGVPVVLYIAENGSWKPCGNLATTETFDSFYVRSDSEQINQIKKVVDNGWASQTYTSVMQQTSDAIGMSVKANYSGNLLKESNAELKASTGHSDDYPHFVGQYKYGQAISKGAVVTLTASIKTATVGETVYVNFHDGGDVGTFKLASTTDAQTVSVTHTMAAAVDGTTKIDFNQNAEYSSIDNEVTIEWAVMLYGENSAVDEWKPTGSEHEAKFILNPGKAGLLVSDGKGGVSTMELSDDKAHIKAKNIKLEGIVTANGGFKINENGSATMNDADVNGTFKTHYADGRDQLVIDKSGITYYSNNGTVLWKQGRSGNLEKSSSIDKWEEVYLLKVPARTPNFTVVYDKSETDDNGHCSYYVKGTKYHQFIASTDSNTYDGIVTADDVSSSPDPASTSITCIEDGEYVLGSASGLLIAMSTSGKYLQHRITYKDGKATGTIAVEGTTLQLAE